MADSINNKAKEYYDNDDTGGSLNNNLKDFLKQQGAEGNSLNTLWRNYAYGEGGNSLNTRLGKLWGTSGSLISRWKDVLGLTWDELKLFFNARRNDPELLLSGATSFDGTDDYISIADDSSLDITDAITVSAWMLTTVTNDHQRIVAKQFETDNGTANSCFQLAIHNNNKFRWAVGGVFDITSSDTIVPNTWNHMVGTYDKTTAKLYVNGQLVQSTSATAVIRTSSQDLTIGATKFDSSIEHETHGSITNVGIWNRALSASEIESIYWKGQYADLKGTELTNLVSWYNLKDTVLGSNLVTNGDFATDSNWTKNTGWSISNGLASCDGSQSSASFLFQDMGLVAGRKYKITFDLSNHSAGSVRVRAGNSATSEGVSGYYNSNASIEVELFGSGSGATFFFEATTSFTGSIDNVVVKEIQAPDSTETNNGSIYGATTLTDAYSASSPFLPRIQDKASDTIANYGEVYGGNAVSFDGTNDYIDTGSSFQSTFRNSFSVSMWVKPDDGQPSAESSFFGTRNSTSQDWIQSNLHTDGKVSFFYRSDNDTAEAKTSSAVFANGVTSWTHIVLIADNSANQLKIFSNGNQLSISGGDLSSITMGDWTSSDELFIGARDNNGTAEKFFDGSINNVKIFNTILTQDQVRELYTKPELTLPTGIASSALKLDMPMQEGSGTAILDGSPTTSDDFITGFVNGSSYPLDSFATNGDDITLFTESASFGGAVSNTFEIVNGNKYLIEFNYTHISGDGVRVVLTNTNTGAGTQISNNITFNSTQTVQSIFTATASSSVGRLQIGTGSGSHSVNCTISNASVKLLGLGQNHGTGSGITWANGQEYGFQHPLVRSNNPMVFDGSNDDVSLGNPSQLNMSSAITVSGWVRVDENNSGNYVIVKETSYGFIITGQAIDFRIFNSGWKTTDTYNIAYGEWHHIVGTHDGSTIKLYINGSLESSVSQSYTIGSSIHSLIIGSYKSLSSYVKMDANEVAVWDSALTASEVTTLYNSGLPLLPTADSGNYASSDDLVGYWRNDGVTTWTDRSTNSNNGTVSGSPASIIVPEGLNEGRDSQGYYLTDTDSISSGIRLKGAEYISVQDSESLSFGNGTSDSPFSLEAWVKMDDVTSFPIVMKGVYNSNAEWHLSTQSGNELFFILYDESVSSTYEGAKTSSITSYEGQWIHITGTYDGRGGTSANNGLKIYINGSSQSLTLIESGTYVAMENLGANVEVGKTGSSTFAKGSIDEVKVYAKELSATEVLKNYNNGKSAHSN